MTISDRLSALRLLSFACFLEKRQRSSYEPGRLSHNSHLNSATYLLFAIGQITRPPCASFSPLIGDENHDTHPTRLWNTRNRMIYTHGKMSSRPGHPESSVTLVVVIMLFRNLAQFAIFSFLVMSPLLKYGSKTYTLRRTLSLEAAKRRHRCVQLDRGEEVKEPKK